MRIYRYAKDNPDDVVELIVNDGGRLKSIYAIHSVMQRQIDTCDSTAEDEVWETFESVKGFVEGFEVDGIENKT